MKETAKSATLREIFDSQRAIHDRDCFHFVAKHCEFRVGFVLR